MTLLIFLPSISEHTSASSHSQTINFSAMWCTIKSILSHRVERTNQYCTSISEEWGLQVSLAACVEWSETIPLNAVTPEADDDVSFSITSCTTSQLMQ